MLPKVCKKGEEFNVLKDLKKWTNARTKREIINLFSILIRTNQVMSLCQREFNKFEVMRSDSFGDPPRDS